MCLSTRPGIGSGMTERTESRLHDTLFPAGDDTLVAGGDPVCPPVQPVGWRACPAAGILAAFGWGVQPLVSAAPRPPGNRVPRGPLPGDHHLSRLFYADLGHPS